MNFRVNNDWRNKSNLNYRHCQHLSSHFIPMHFPIANYYSLEADSNEFLQKKSDLNEVFPDNSLLNNLHKLENPLQKNLGDSTMSYNKKSPNGYSISYTMNNHTRNEEPDQLTSQSNRRMDFHPFAGIANFISGVIHSVTSAMSSQFNRRPESPNPKYYDCPYQCDTDPKDSGFEDYSFHDDSPPLDDLFTSGHCAKIENDQNKNVIMVHYSNEPGQCGENAREIHTNAVAENAEKEMNARPADCRAVAAQVEDKLTKVRQLLARKEEVPPSKPIKSRRPKKAFVQPGSVEENYEDALQSEDFDHLENSAVFDCISPGLIIEPVLSEIDGPKVAHTHIQESMQIVKNVNNETVKTEDINESNDKIDTLHKHEIKIDDKKTEIILSCEDKVNRLKALLAERKSKNVNTKELDAEDPVNTEIDRKPKCVNERAIPVSKIHSKRFKNPCRLSVGRRKQAQLKKDIEDDMNFCENIDEESISSFENSPTIHITPAKKDIAIELTNSKCFFDEVRGRFCDTSTTESEDSFQIVFSDSSQNSPRLRKLSDCGSEDSFIVFEDGSPDSCYVSTDVFGDRPTESEFESDDESEYDSDFSDSGQIQLKKCAINNCLSRTVSDLTDDSLYDENAVISKSQAYSDSEDEVDCSVQNICVEMPCQDSEVDGKSEQLDVSLSTGLLLNEEKKLARKNNPPKQVRFAEGPPKVHVMRVWAFAARQARAGHWEQHAIDRERFKRRIADVDMAISWVLKQQHRARVKFQRFMPWWHAQRRKEEAEKKERKELERQIREKEKFENVENLLNNDEIVNNEVKDSVLVDKTDGSDLKNVENVLQSEHVNTQGQENFNTNINVSDYGKSGKIIKSLIDNEETNPKNLVMNGRIKQVKG